MTEFIKYVKLQDIEIVKFYIKYILTDCNVNHRCQGWGWLNMHMVIE